ncbi:hypothetical protein OAS39_13040 [Pirellulales bacterium]|nr:hypothetical protein [Pirellulales bacterium]
MQAESSRQFVSLRLIAQVAASRARLIVVLVAVAATITLVVRNSASHAPVQDGSVAEFWIYACDTDVKGDMQDFEKSGGIYPPQDGWGIYYISGYHDEYLHRVRLSDLARTLPKLEVEFKRRASKGELHPWLAKVAEQWTCKGDYEREVQRLLSLIRDADLAATKADDKELYTYALDCETQFEHRWQRAKYYWFTLVFEIGWLSFILLFAALPFLRKAGWVAWAIHLGLALPLLFVPFFFGYAPFTFTSAFPAGGVFYPYVIIWFRGLPLTDFDIWFFEHAPQPFEPLTQHPGPMMAVTGLGAVGPLAVFGLGLAVSFSVFTVAAFRRFLKASTCRKPIDVEPM